MSASWLKELNLKPRSNSVKTFKSYVDLNEPDPNEKQKDIPKSSADKNRYEEQPVAYPTPSFLPGELVIAEAENVLKFNTLSELNKGVSGLLICTNFKLSFLTAETFPSHLHQRNLLLAENDICLINIDAIYHVAGGKRKKITIGNLSGSVEILEVHCKDFRIYTFSFKFSPANHKAVISAIFHHAFASRLHLLFAFDYSEPSSYSDKNALHSLKFTKPNDWETELHRCKCPGWRITQGNEKFLLCESLPECFVIPAILLDMNLNKAAPYFSGHRVPTWSWGLPSGASIIRMAAVDPGISDNQQLDLMIDAISRTNPELPKAKLFNADELCPSVKEIQNSFFKLKELCMPTTAQEYWEVDNTYLSRLESTKWLHNVSACLTVSQQAALTLQKNTSVVFMESEGRDVNCILSSLVQIFLDPSYHKQSGFQDLIQKEWVALGHPFTERLHHISGCENEESPVFLLFLDCVWQLMQQCPTVFEFSETYLTTLWDSCHVSLFDTFLFSNHKNRTEAMYAHGSNSNFRLRSTWNWAKQFTRNDIKLFRNPLYILNKYKDITKGQPSLSRPRSFTSVMESRHSQRRPLEIEKSKNQLVSWHEDEENLLKIDPNIKSLSLWHQCYLRWIPLAQILGGGPPLLFLHNMKLADEILALEKASTRTKPIKPPSLHRRAASDECAISANIIDTCHLQDGSRVITSAFPFAPVAPWDWHAFQFVPSMSCMQISYSSDDELDD